MAEVQGSASHLHLPGTMPGILYSGLAHTGGSVHTYWKTPGRRAGCLQLLETGKAFIPKNSIHLSESALLQSTGFRIWQIPARAPRPQFSQWLSSLAPPFAKAAPPPCTHALGATGLAQFFCSVVCMLHRHRHGHGHGLGWTSRSVTGAKI